MHGRISKALTVITIFALLATGCTSQAYNIGMAKDKEHRVIDTGFSASTVGSYDSADTAVVMTVDQDNSGIIFMNMDTGRQYTLYYDGTTYVTDKYDGPMSISQIRAGDVVDVNFLKGKRQIASIKQSPDAWVYDSIDNYDLGGLNKTASIGNSTYSLPDEAVILSEGKRVEAMEIVSQDLVTIRGIDRKIYSVNVERGHGYLRLRNEQALIGGWIEVGNKVIREISEDMLLVVPEGSYQVALSNGGVSSIKDVVIERDRETVLDVSDIEIVQDKTGRILFTVNPAGADVSIDGELTDISSPVELPYGIHKIHMEADGYDSLTKYIQVGSEYAKISFELEEKKEEEAPTISGNDLTVPPLEEKEIPELEYAPVKDPEPSVSDNTISATKSNKVYIDSPKGVEVYLDGNYVGIAPVSFKKNAGKHTITLEKSGYKKKSYTIYLYNDGEDVTYSFSELEKDEPTKEPPKEPSVSGNDVDDHKHKYTEEITKKPTCVDKGEKTFTCECGESYTEPIDIDKTAHEYDKGECINCHEKDPGHDHEYKEEITKKPTCIAEGEITYTCECGYFETKPIDIDKTAHEYDKGECINCHEKDPGHNHEFKEEITTEPSCTAEGEKTYKCECGYSYTSSIDKTAHNYKETGKEDPTCEAEGKITLKCTQCDSIDTQPIPAKGHSYDDARKCTVCGALDPNYKPPENSGTGEEGAVT